MNDNKRKALGRGLSALIPGGGGTGTAAVTPLRRDYFECAIEDVYPSADNPRKLFDKEALAELAESIRTQGLVQPLVVRQRKEGGYVLIAGERRWRAAQLAGLKSLHVVVRESSESEAFERALVENLQREDLSPIEEAEAYQRLIGEHGYTQDALAGRVGRDRTSIANTLRLLKLPPKVRHQVNDGTLPMGHARALLGLLERGADGPSSVERLAAQVVQKSLSVRQTEALVKREKTGGASGKKPAPTQSASVRDLQTRLERALGTRVRLVQKSQQAGVMEIDWASLDQLDSLLEKILGG